MAFDAQQMHFPTTCPNPELLARLTQGSPLKTPE